MKFNPIACRFYDKVNGYCLHQRVSKHFVIDEPTCINVRKKMYCPQGFK